VLLFLISRYLLTRLLFLPLVFHVAAATIGCPLSVTSTLPIPLGGWFNGCSPPLSRSQRVVFTQFYPFLHYGLVCTIVTHCIHPWTNTSYQVCSHSSFAFCDTFHDEVDGPPFLLVFLILSFQLCICWNEQLLSRGLFFATARELTTSLVFLICNEIFVSGIS
jgi:hypothetical protein